LSFEYVVKITQSNVITIIEKISVGFGVRIKKRAIERAVELRVNIVVCVKLLFLKGRALLRQSTI